LRQTLVPTTKRARLRQRLLGKNPAMMQALDQPPYYAFEIFRAQQDLPCPAITLGGLRVNENDGGVSTTADATFPASTRGPRRGRHRVERLRQRTFAGYDCSVGRRAGAGALCK